MTLLLLGAGCMSGDLAALCDATARDRQLAAMVTGAEGSDAVVMAVQPLIAKTDKACRER